MELATFLVNGTELVTCLVKWHGACCGESKALVWSMTWSLLLFWSMARSLLLVWSSGMEFVPVYQHFLSMQAPVLGGAWEIEHWISTPSQPWRLYQAMVTMFSNDTNGLYEGLRSLPVQREHNPSNLSDFGDVRRSLCAVMIPAVMREAAVCRFRSHPWLWLIT